MKIDLTKLNGYTEEMSAEEKLALLLDTDFETPKPSTEGMVSKATFDKTASDLAKYKKQALEAMSQAEREKAEKEEAFNSLNAKYETLVKEKNIADNKAKFLSLGYEDDAANRAANALFSGDTETLFEIQRMHTDRVRETAIADKVKSMPTPVGGQPTSTTFTKEQIATMSAEEINANWESIQSVLSN